ncbi:hypothetical protein KIW84_040109 [Lathyrus oleraceus]|uniref:Uncharacterized protein n=1 Tax=Pisum sativum TaxID=3888 RepID=A0A9D4X995_PEA|nr:hypothetical protein KIW84_040109 [Pisum sativum]
MDGRVTLFNFVLNSIPIYSFSFYKAPKCVIQDIIKIQRDFLRGGDLEKRKVAWIRWDLVCKPKDQGGLGRNNRLGSPSLDRLFSLIFASVVDQKLKVLNIGECVDNGWVWDMKITDYRPLQVDEEAELESLMVILQDV